MPFSDVNARRLALIEKLLHLPEARLSEVEQLFSAVTPSLPVAESQGVRNWPHAPLHRLSDEGTYIVTAGTHQREHYFAGSERLDLLESALLTLAKNSGWQLEAWAVFSNHYHFVGHALPGCEPLAAWLTRLHQQTAGQVNDLDHVSGRQVWFNYWETQLTFETSYLGRLNYVHQNAVRHGLVRVANQYRWCSAAWFERTATTAQVRTIYAFKTDKIKIEDDYDPV